MCVIICILCLGIRCTWTYSTTTEHWLSGGREGGREGEGETREGRRERGREGGRRKIEKGEREGEGRRGREMSSVAPTVI